jgi:hypothetical protein
MEIHQFFIGKTDCVIPWDIQAELTHIDLAYVAIMLKLDYKIQLSEEFEDHITIEEGKLDREIDRIVTKSKFENPTITILLYYMLNISPYSSFATIDSHNKRFILDAKEILNIDGLVWDLLLGKTVLYKALKLLVGAGDKNTDTKENTINCWLDFIENVKPTATKSARKI